jgi:hypothetical protein
MKIPKKSRGLGIFSERREFAPKRLIVREEVVIEQGNLG